MLKEITLNIITVIKKSNLVFKICINEPLDSKNIREFINSIIYHIKDCKKLIIDLLDSPCINSIVIGALLDLHSKYSCKIKIINSHQKTARILEYTKLNDIDFIEIVKYELDEDNSFETRDWIKEYGDIGE